jgi:hypothetical protein
MVQSNAGDVALCHQVQEQCMGGGEHARILHAQTREIVDVEETPVVDLVEGRPPVGQPIRLQVQQLVQTVEALRHPALPVDLGDGVIDVCADRG